MNGFRTPCQPWKMDLFARIVNYWSLLVIFSKRSILHVLSRFWLRLCTVFSLKNPFLVSGLSEVLIPWEIFSSNPSVISQKGESQNGCSKKAKHAKFSEKRTFTPWYALCFVFLKHPFWDSPFYLINDESRIFSGKQKQFEKCKRYKFLLC